MRKSVTVLLQDGQASLHNEVAFLPGRRKAELALILLVLAFALHRALEGQNLAELRVQSIEGGQHFRIRVLHLLALFGGEFMEGPEV